MKPVTCTLIAALIFSLSHSFGQGGREKYNHSKIAAHCLNADVKAALQLLTQSELSGLSKRDSVFWILHTGLNFIAK